MKLALMQPYLFPYLGYYQLAEAVDEFVFYDDAAFIKQGFVNRNAILLSGARHEFALPVLHASSFRTIAEHQYQGRFDAFLKMLHHAYAKAPFFSQASALVEQVLADRSDDLCVARKNAASIKAVFEYLGIEKRFSLASDLRLAPDVRSEARVIEVCRYKQADEYLNSIGGMALYDAEHFAAAGVVLQFIEPRFTPYRQGKASFVPALSIIDVLMWCSPQQIRDLLKDYKLVAGGLAQCA